MHLCNQTEFIVENISIHSQGYFSFKKCVQKTNAIHLTKNNMSLFCNCASEITLNFKIDKTQFGEIIIINGH